MPSQTESTIESEITDVTNEKKSLKKPKTVIVWRNVILMSLLHFAAVYGLILCFTSAQWKTVAFGIFLCIISMLSITAGAHRLWTHRSYKAKWQLRLLLCFFNCIALQNDIYEWSRDHRVHHKYSETDADPHNAKRGFFFSHIGWLLVKKHPEVIEKGKTIDFSDLWADPIFLSSIGYALLFHSPDIFAAIYWNETKLNAFFVCVTLRYCWSLHMTWLVNSAAHMWGYRPYDKHINPTENKFVVFGAIGEGFHNYHHTFPWDYSTSELGLRFNLTTIFIDFLAMIGWAYDSIWYRKEFCENRKMFCEFKRFHGYTGKTFDESGKIIDDVNKIRRGLYKSRILWSDTRTALSLVKFWALLLSAFRDPKFD